MPAASTHYFGRESKDIVVFEDLDRFEDPHIFEALRELNNLLNETPERRRKRRGNLPGRALRRLFGLGVPLRFVYAVRDSVFEKIDAPGVTADADSAARTAGTGEPTGTTATATAPDRRVDAAAAVTLRANRTKFFDIVIPLVPFISHRNARDLLLKLLAERGITGIEPRLVNIVAQHCTDMRLMRNMCNEYLVFAERLLEPEEPNKAAPGMDESHLFALVAYKNFHLEDFENVTRRDSDLDHLYELYQRMVRATIAAKDKRKRALLDEPDRFRARDPLAKQLGARLELYGSTVQRAESSQYQNWRYYRLKVGTREFGPDELTGYAFWSAVANVRSVSVVLSMHETGGQSTVASTLGEDVLTMFVPEGLDAHRWTEFDANAVQTEFDDIERDIEQLRRADFAELVAMPRFTLTPNRTAPGTATPQGQTFADLLSETLKSQLACDLVRRGYIDRNFSLYAAQFYGRFTGIDVANFMVQDVQTNTMAVDYDLSRTGAVANLFAETEEAGEQLEHTAAAYNIDIVNHLLTADDSRAGAIVDNLIAGWPGQDSQTFLATYFTSSNAERERLAAVLAEHRWRDVFTYLVADDDVPTNARADLVSAAMCAFDPHATYTLGDNVREFITTNYRTMPAFTEQHPAEESEPPAERVPERLDVMLDRAGVVIPKLNEVLDSRLHKLIVDANRYRLTAENLRSALGTSGNVSLNQVHNDQTVYAYCLDQLPTYLAAVDQDTKTDHALNTPQTLATVLNDIVEDWGGEQVADPDSGDVADLLARTSLDARLSSLGAVPKSTWTALAAADLFRASLANIEDYRAYVGSIDAHLATLLERAGTIHVTEPDDITGQDGNQHDRQTAAIAILNATGLTPGVRVNLVASLGAQAPLSVDDIAPSADNMFALLLDRGMVHDDETSFKHFHGGGWTAIGPAINASNNIATFIKPDLVLGMVAKLLADPTSSGKVGKLVIDDVEEYVPEDQWAELKAVALYVNTNFLPLAPDTVVRIARVGRENEDVDAKLVLRLLCTTSPAATADHIVAVFAQLGKPYADISRSGAKFKVDRDATHDQLLKVLKEANRITRGAPRGHYSATVL